MTETLVLLDNTVLSNFGLTQQSELVLKACPGRACTTEAALREYLAAFETDHLAGAAWRNLPVIALSDDERRLERSFSAGLGAGERTCLAVAMARHGILATDDLHARRVAMRQGVATTGTIGLLVMAVEADLLSPAQANTLLAAMIAAGYRSPVTDVEALLASSLRR